MFVVRNELKYTKDAASISSTEKKTKGRRRVESTPVLSKHRFDSFRSDLPPFFI